MKNKNVSDRSRLVSDVKMTVFGILVSVALSIQSASAAVWDALPNAADSAWATFASVYSNKVWLVPLVGAAFGYFKATEDRTKHIFRNSAIGCIILFLACKVPISVYQQTGDVISSWFPW